MKPRAWAVVYAAVVLFVSWPIWSVAHFMTQDGPSHLHSSYLMSALLKGDPAATARYAFNSLAVPNATGHWLIVLLGGFLSPLVITKVLVTATYAGFVAAVTWLRWRTVGPHGMVTTVLLSAALGFNWLWLAGLYNFNIGVIGLIVATGLFHSWRDRLTPTRTAALSGLVLLVYFSHLVAFVILTGSLVAHGVTLPRHVRARGLAALCLALVPVAPLMALHLGVMASGEPWVPHWRSLTDPSSLAGWFDQIRSADPFILISRKTLPFSSVHSSALALFAPGVWIVASMACLGWLTMRGRRVRTAVPKTMVPFVVMFLLTSFAALVGPDDLGRSHGAVLRERLLLCGIVSLIPLFRAEGPRVLERLAQACLVAVVLFQTAALWEYARQTDASVAEFLLARAAIGEDAAVGAVVIVEDGGRFHSVPEAQMNAVNGIGREGPVWDNYELGSPLFPIVARSGADRLFILEWTRASLFDRSAPQATFAASVARLTACLETSHGRITQLLVWGRDARVEAVLDRWFGPSPEFVSGRVRILRHR